MTQEFGSLENRVRELRENRGYSAKQLGEMCGWSEAKQSRLETGDSTLRPNEVKRLAEAFGVPPIQIFFDIDMVARTHEERDLIARFRAMNSRQKHSLAALIESFLQK